MARKRTAQKPAVHVSIGSPQDLSSTCHPMTERLITVLRPGHHAEDIGWIMHRRYNHSFPADFEIIRYGGTTFGFFGSLEAAEAGAQLYGRRYAALPPFSSFAQALGPHDEICNACGQPLPEEAKA